MSASVPMEGVRTVRKRHGVTINDVVLAVCGGALRRYLDGLWDDALAAYARAARAQSKGQTP